MATIDDFFAKRDKKKSKAKKQQFAEVQSRISEESTPASKRPQEPEIKPKEAVAPAVAVETPVIPEEIAKIELKSSIPAQEGEVWAEFEEERQIDYTGLRIQKLTVEDEPQSDNTPDRKDGSRESESGETGTSSSGPWNKVAVGTTEPSAVEKPVVALPNVNASSVYVPPNLRSSTSVKPTRGKQKQAPDITSTDFFPTLEAAVEVVPKTKKQLEEESRGFAEAKPSRSHSRTTEQTTPGSHLNLGNKFGVLSEN